MLTVAVGSMRMCCAGCVGSPFVRKVCIRVERWFPEWEVIESPLELHTGSAAPNLVHSWLRTS